MSSNSSPDVPIGVTDSGLEVTPRFIQGLRDVGMESLADYYEGLYMALNSYLDEGCTSPLD
jgi:hypothetical protein